MIAKIFINSAPLLVEPSEQGGAPRLALESQPSNDNFVGTIYFGHWFKGDKGKSAYDLAVQSGYQGSEEQYGLYPIVQGDYAKAKGDYAIAQGERTKEIGDHTPQIINGFWWLFNYDTKEYESSGIVANGMYPTFDINTQTMELTMSVAEGFTGGNFTIDSKGQLNFII